MSRPSRVTRESIFNSGPQLHGHELHATCSPSLLECVQHLEDINAETHDAQLLLRAGTSDLKRMSHVLSSQRVFVFVNESTVRNYKADLEEEIEPQVRELIERAKRGAKALEKRHHALKSKVCPYLLVTREHS
ncbi:hypothetical protein SCHPADRAFT_835248 [Schizopora paradoxa]|uniref:DASH complex subunit SPC19 n=1 Tax=Schizopora paradoxa TaxID=27342 RepID=A0A0H2RG74_9AGAM|nr:hypothetical protein SCHPADRAFT_835248 [Schizopora paradoxa]